MWLLIAEDEVDLAEALTAFFEKNHFSVDAVHNGADAYEYAVSSGYDAVILDVMMPRMNGIQVLERLRAEGVKTPIMMLTAKGQKNDRITGFNAGDIPMTDGFGTGRYAMMLEGPWKSAELAGAYPDVAYGTAPIPAGEGGSISVLGGEDIAMFNTANKDGAWKFMKFMTSEYAQEEMAKCGQIPVSTAALESQTVKDASFAPFLEAITTAKARPTVASWSEIDNALTVAMTDMIVNGADVQKTLDQLAVTIDGLLAE